ncbi:MAG: cupin domain-containing protein [Acetobacteraceae bacterium]
MLLSASMPAVAEQPAKADAVQILRNGSRASTTGDASNFVGSVRVDRLFSAATPSRMSGGNVTFEPGARSNWHTHPVGQVLIVTAGLGWVQQAGGEIQEMRPGDVVVIAPDVRHWHGASPTTSVTHIALQEQEGGSAVNWLEPVTDAQYRR